MWMRSWSLSMQVVFMHPSVKYQAIYLSILVKPIEGILSIIDSKAITANSCSLLTTKSETTQNAAKLIRIDRNNRWSWSHQSNHHSRMPQLNAETSNHITTRGSLLKTLQYSHHSHPGSSTLWHIYSATWVHQPYGVSLWIDDSLLF